MPCCPARSSHPICAFRSQEDRIRELLAELPTVLVQLVNLDSKHGPIPKSPDLERDLEILRIYNGADRQNGDLGAANKFLPSCNIWSSKCLFEAARGRIVFKTERGFLGLVIQSIALQIEVWILAGAKMRFLLRKMAEGGGTYRLVGGACLHVFMYGECISEADELSETLLCDSSD